MAQTPPPFLSSDFSHSRHRKAMAALIVAGVLFLAIVLPYILRPASEPQPTAADSLAAQQSLASQNPPSGLSQEEIRVRQAAANRPNPPSGLSQEQVKARQSIVENF